MGKWTTNNVQNGRYSIDWKRHSKNMNGKVNLKEFLFSMIRCPGLEIDEDDSNETYH